MVSMEYVARNASRFKKTSSATLYKDKDNVYKVIDRYTLLYKSIINNIINNYKIHNDVDKHIILPTGLVIDSSPTVIGYQCDFVKGHNLEKLAKDLSTEEKIIVLNKLTDLLKEINSFLVVGDINLANCMYDKNLDGYLIDFDLSTLLGEEPSRMTLYNFAKKNTNKEIRSNLNTDKLKMAIICASLLYKTDFEASFVSAVPYNKWNKFYQFTDNSYLKDYFKSAFKALNHDHEITDYLYLPTDQSFIRLIDEDFKKIRKKY